jgi:CHAT domain-containing protein/lipopolysaccharide biosynthesis regulator YciM
MIWFNSILCRIYRSFQARRTWNMEIIIKNKSIFFRRFKDKFFKILTILCVIAMASMPTAVRADTASLKDQALEHMRQGQLAEAAAKAELYREEVRARSGEESLEYAEVLQLFAILQMTKGRLEEAEASARKALQLTERFAPDDNLQMGIALNALASVYGMQGRTEEGRILLQRIAALWQIIVPEANLTRMADLDFGSIKDFLEIEAIIKRNLESIENLPGDNEKRTLDALSSLGNLYTQHGKCDQAEPILARLQNAILNSSRTDILLKNSVKHYAAECAARRGAFDEAEQLYLAVLDADRETAGGASVLSVASQHGLVKLKLLQREPAEALKYARDLAQLYRLRQKMGAAEQTPLGQGFLLSTARYAFMDVLSSAWQVTVAVEGEKDRLFDEAFEAAQWGGSSSAGEAAAQLGARLAAGSGDLAGSIRQIQELRRTWLERDRSLLELLATGAAPERVAKVRREMTWLEQRLLRSEPNLLAKYPSYRSLIAFQTVSAREAQTLLAPDEAIVLIASAEDESFIFAVTNQETRWARSDLGADALTRTVQALRCGLDEEQWATPTGARQCSDQLGFTEAPDPASPLPFDISKAYELYEALFGQVEDLIKGKRLFIVPSTPLTSLPFHVLVAKKPETALPKSIGSYRDAAWLARTNAIATLPSVSSLKALRQRVANSRKATDDYAGYGNPLLKGDGASCGSTTVPETCPAARQHVSEAPGKRAAISNQRAVIRGRNGQRSASANTDDMFASGAAVETVLEQVRALCPLPDTAYEIRCVADRFKEKSRLIRLAGDAREADLKALSANGRLARYRILHFATHGLLSGDVERLARRRGEPALVLTPPEKPADADDDGLLTASEVSALKLNADWVVLSACNTAAGDKIGAEALSGLARAFLYAGARALLVSHWPVYSDAAVRLTIRSFAELDGDPRASHAEALRQAMIDLIDDRRQDDNAHPAVWAPFVVVGEGGR